MIAGGDGSGRFRVHVVRHWRSSRIKSGKQRNKQGCRGVYQAVTPLIRSSDAMKTARLALVPLALATLSAPALAGPAINLAQAHIAAIAKGDVAAIMATTAPNATLHWIGGPLDGTYASADAQKPVWTKFTTAQGEQKTTVSDLTEAANPKGATVMANVVFAGKNAVKVRYVMLYTDGKLVDEIWQVDPDGKY